MTCIELVGIGQKLSTTLKSKGLAIVASRPTHQNRLKSSQVSDRKVSLLLAKLRIHFPAHLWVREFWQQIYVLSQPWIEAYCPRF